MRKIRYCWWIITGQVKRVCQNEWERHGGRDMPEIAGSNPAPATKITEADIARCLKTASTPYKPSASGRGN